MEPMKFEDNIREKLQEREIEPSKDAWKKLDAQLQTSREKSSNRSIWFAVAASFIGILIIASFLFKDEVITLQNTTDLVIENTDEFDNKKEILFSDEETKNIRTKESKIVENTTQKENQLTINESAIIPKNTSDIAKTSDNSVKKSIQKKYIEKSETNKPIEDTNENLFIDLKVIEVVAQVKSLQKEKERVSNEEINALLLKAQWDIQTQKIINGKFKKVDATALLYEVESELEKSFRDQVFEALGDGFEKVRTAVVERNN